MEVQKHAIFIQKHAIFNLEGSAYYRLVYDTPLEWVVEFAYPKEGIQESFHVVRAVMGHDYGNRS